MNVDTMLIMTWAVYVAFGVIALQWLDILRLLISLRSTSIPDHVNLGARDAVKQYAEDLGGFSPVSRRMRNLMTAWAEGWSPRGIVTLAATQSTRANNRLRFTALFLLLVFAAAITQSNLPKLAWIGIAAVGVTFFIKGLLSSCIDAQIERNLIAKLPANIASTAMTAAELAGALGGAIESAFKNYVPQPERFATAISQAVDTVGKASSHDVEALNKKLVDSQSALLEKWTSHEKATIASLDAARKSLDSVSSHLTSGLQSSSEKILSALTHHVQQIEKATHASNAALKTSLDGHVQQLDKASHTSNDTLKASLTMLSDSLAKSGQIIAGQLDKIMALEKDIQQVLHVQQVTDGTLKSISAAEEFKQMLVALRSHLTDSDKLLREVGKPRMIRLVEKESDEASGG